MPEIKEYPCPNCGGQLAFDSSLQKMKCTSCDSTFEVEDAESYAKCKNQEDDLTWNREDETFSDNDNLSVFTCKSCGGEILQEKDDISSSCPYCGNAIVNTGKVTGVLKPDLFIPFKYNKKEAKEKYISHVKSKKIVPHNFLDENHIDEIKGIYVPFWLYDADVDADVTFTAIKTRSHRDGDYMVTETDHYLLVRSGSLSFEKVPVDASVKIDDVLMQSIEPYDIKEAVDFNTAYIAGYQAEKYSKEIDETESDANRRIVRSTVDAFKETTVNYEMVNVATSSVRTKNGNAHYALLPVWILNTHYKGKDYIFAMNAQTGKFIGDLPADTGLAIGLFFKTFLSTSFVTALLVTLYIWLVK